MLKYILTVLRYILFGIVTSIVSFFVWNSWMFRDFDYFLKYMGREHLYTLPGGIIIGFLVGLLAVYVERKTKDQTIKRLSPIFLMLLIVVISVFAFVAIGRVLAWQMGEINSFMDVMEWDLSITIPGGIIVGFIVGLIAVNAEKKTNMIKKRSIPLNFAIIVILTTLIVSSTIELFLALTVT